MCVLLFQATDGGGRSTQEILEINVVNGPNLKSPSFPQLVYDVAVSEGASIGAEVITLEVSNSTNLGVVSFMKYITCVRGDGLICD